MIDLIIILNLAELGVSSSNGEPVPCEFHKQSILNQIVEGVVENAEQESENGSIQDDLVFDNFIDEIEQISSPFSSWLDKIVVEADRAVKSNDDGKYDNVMFNKAFAKDFIRLCKLLPLWSAISCDIFGISEPTSSSSNVECDFKNIKQALDDIIPCSADTFVQEHIELMKGQVLEASQHENYIKFIGGMDNDDRCSDTINSSYECTKNHSERSNDCDASAENIENSFGSMCGDESINKNADSSDVIEPVALNECPACKNGDLPGDAHLCIKCNKPVHALPGCSVSCGEEEGYGQKRICLACSSKARIANIDKHVLQTAKEMNYKEEWDKSRKKYKSKYLSPAPNWHLNTNIKKKVKCGILQNGNICTTTHQIDGETVGLRNTCGVDCICQVNSQIYHQFKFHKLNLLLNAFIKISRHWRRLMRISNRIGCI